MLRFLGLVLEVGLEPTKRVPREIYSLLSLPLDDSSNSYDSSIFRQDKQAKTLFLLNVGEDFGRILHENVIKFGFGIVAGELFLGLGDLGIIAAMVNIGTASENELVFGELLDSFLRLFAILSNNTAEVALEKDALLR